MPNNNYPINHYMNSSYPTTSPNFNFVAQEPHGLQPQYYMPELRDFSLSDIQLRYKVIKIFLEHQDKSIQMLLQNCNKHNYWYSSSDNRIQVFTHQCQHNCGWIFTPGTWINHQTNLCGHDIISLHAYSQHLSYSQSLHELDAAFCSKGLSRVNPTEGVTTKWHIQQRNSIAAENNQYCDLFCNHFNNLSRYNYSNKFGRIIGFVEKFMLYSGEEAEIFYTLWRRHDSEKEKCAALFPEKPYMIYNQHLITDDINKVIFRADEASALPHTFAADYNFNDIFPDNPYRIGLHHPGTIESACPGGLGNIIDADFSLLTGKKICIDISNLDINRDFIVALKTKVMQINGTLHLRYQDMSNSGSDSFQSPLYVISVDEMLNSCSYFNLVEPQISIQETPGLHRKGTEIDLKIKETNYLLYPILKSGSIIWLFGPAKSGKTTLALYIAHAVATGKQPLDLWKPSGASSVLYIDAEMPYAELEAIIKKIMNHDNSADQNPTLPFDIYNIENAHDRNASIYDDEVQQAINSIIPNYELVIIDNYYSITNNSRTALPFVKWLRTHTQNNTAFIILDHTNRDDMLQGDITKTRAMDLGIKLTKIDSNRINVEYENNRYGADDQFQPRTLIRHYSDKTIHYEIEEEEVINSKQLSQQYHMYAAILALNEAHQMSPADIALKVKLSRSQIDNILNTFKDKSSLSDAQKNSVIKSIDDNDKQLIIEQKENLSLRSEEEILGSIVTRR